ncbi:26S Proteasome Non-Atpase Regulatory Subunit 3 [Manis pentadactyla]|nr:26S Proteasome Non-Atpase Regulatory Subunit 3 [Manis pentadactyla]
MFKRWIEDEGANREASEEMGENINDVISYREIEKDEVQNKFFRIDIRSSLEPALGELVHYRKVLGKHKGLEILHALLRRPVREPGSLSRGGPSQSLRIRDGSLLLWTQGGQGNIQAASGNGGLELVGEVLQGHLGTQNQVNSYPVIHEDLEKTNSDLPVVADHSHCSPKPTRAFSMGLRMLMPQRGPYVQGIINDFLRKSKLQCSSHLEILLPFATRKESLDVLLRPKKAREGKRRGENKEKEKDDAGSHKAWELPGSGARQQSQGSGQPRAHADVREAHGLGLSGRLLSGGLPDKLHFTRPALARSTPRSAGEQKPQLCGL